MTANQAREKSQASNKEAYNKQYGLIINAIKKATEEGLYRINLYESVLNDVRATLIEDGYNIEISSDRNETIYLITW